jgi:hypothetical protein
MATLSVFTSLVAGVAVTQTAATAAGDKFTNTGNEVILVTNGGVGSTVVTLDAKATPIGLTLTDPTVTVANGAVKVIGPFNTDIFNDTSGFMNLTYSVDTSVTVAVMKVSPQ